MGTIRTVDARANFSDMVNRAAYGGERVILERRGKAVAAVVSIADLELLEALEDRMDIEAARKALKEKGGQSWEKVKAELGL